MEKKDVRSQWKVQRWSVYLFLFPAIFGTILVSHWFYKGRPSPVPWESFLVMMGGWAATLISGFINWRCPQCNSLLQTSRDSGTGRFFSTLSDAFPANPDVCSHCGAILNG